MTLITSPVSHRPPSAVAQPVRPPSGVSWPRRALAVVAVLVAAAGIGLVSSGPSGNQVVHVEVGTKRVRLVGRATAASALAAARVHPHSGALRSVVTGRTLDPAWHPYDVMVNDRPAAPGVLVHDGDRVSWIDGADSLEATASQDSPSHWSGLPDVERELWHPGRDGVDRTVAGLISGEVVRRAPEVAPLPAAPDRSNVVTLSFDDGPNPDFTPQVLDILHREGIKAMFCDVGYASDHFPNLVRAEAAAGMTMCDHTLHHMIDLPARPQAQIHDEIWQQADKMQQLEGTGPAFYRPPGGALSADVIRIAHERGLRVVTWDVDPHDYEKPTAPVILARVLSQVRPGSVILLHDGGGDRSQTVAMLTQLIDTLRTRGFTFVAPGHEPPVPGPPTVNVTGEQTARPRSRIN